ncbi:ABC transporter ATP-binding protein [Candidatus Xianfuyuplasma coldseepsis]|uniref:ABC transporter ATP-binding protein n=1 Tax=Candidatus Xianfuyuplasma coldseepsis TaxID=2782163 RepID=A0A7L7KRC5_9MOLU|nr:ABC transporter ATP-binding protein [Xianfuyuplasma coldseepsis]QMS85380.1 ABC transporter ATP-binding protein [Xianfuyuplasma coldseepsis]
MLKLHNIQFSYDKKQPILDDFNIDVDKGEIVAILGRSGSGKSSILRVIAGLETPQSGDVVIDGNIVNNVPTSKRNVGLVFQNHALFPHLTIRKNIEYGLFNMSSAMKKERCEEVAKKVDILELLDRYPHEISGGQKQRAAIARSLVTKPKILLLDEPFTALDQELKQSIRLDILRILKQFNITTIIVTHDIDDAIALHARVIQLQ